MIAVICRNGEHFSVDPTHIERVEIDPDTVIHLIDGTKYVVSESFGDLLRTIRDHRASLLVVQKRLAGGTAEIADHASTVRASALRIERRQHSRDGDSTRSAADRRSAADSPDPDGD
jgi:flagellar protein FlbD